MAGPRNPKRQITRPAEAQEEILRIVAERYLGSLTPGTPDHEHLARMIVVAGLWRPKIGQ